MKRKFNHTFAERVSVQRWNPVTRSHEWVVVRVEIDGKMVAEALKLRVFDSKKGVAKSAFGAIKVSLLFGEK